MADGLRRRDFRVKNLDVSGQATGNVGTIFPDGDANTWYVDGSQATGSSGDGTTWKEAFLTITEAMAVAGSGDVVYVAAKTIVDYTGDPTSYAETVIIPYAASNLALIGVNRGRTQGGLPQIKIGAGSTAMITVRAPGCLIANIGINGAGSTGGGILLDDDYAAKAAFGTSIVNCHIKNCKVTTKVADGGGIYTTAAGNAWQLLVSGCNFYKNEIDVCLVGTSNTQPQDWIIEDCIMSGPAANTNCNLYLKGAGSGINGVTVKNCTFTSLPALSSGGTNRYIDATGCVGTLTGCTFGCEINPTSSTELTFKAAGTGAFIPATMWLSNCWGTTDTAGESGEIHVA